MDAFTRQYIETALWSSTDDKGEPLDKRHSIADIARPTLVQMEKDAAAFQEHHAELLDRAYRVPGYDAEHAGHDFWLTREGHGAGFWDRGMGRVGDELTKAAKPYGSFDLYVGDDGRIYGSGYERDPNGAHETPAAAAAEAPVIASEDRPKRKPTETYRGWKLWVHHGKKGWGGYADVQNGVVTRHSEYPTKEAVLADLRRWIDQIGPQSAEARETVTAAAEASPCCPHGGAEVDTLAPGYYAIAPDGRVMGGPFTSYSDAKAHAAPHHGYVRLAAEDKGGARGGYCIPYIRMIRDAEAYESCLAEWGKDGRRIATARDVYDALHTRLAAEDQEVFLVMLVDVRGQCIGVDEVARGARDRVEVDIARVFSSVAVYRPHHYIVVHNHPSRKANPSKSDRELTKTIEQASQPFSRSSAFVDHVVIGMGEFYSFADDKLHRVKGHAA